MKTIAEIKARKNGEIKTKNSASSGKGDKPRGSSLIQNAVRADTINRIHQSIKPREADGNGRADDGSSAAPVERVEQAATFTSEHALAAMERGKRLAAAKSRDKKQKKAAEQAKEPEAPAKRTAKPAAPNAANASPRIRPTASQDPASTTPGTTAHTPTPTEQAKRTAAAKSLWDKKQKQAAEQAQAQAQEAAVIRSATPYAPDPAPPAPAPGSAPKPTTTPTTAPKGVQGQSAGTKRSTIRESNKGNIPIKEKSLSKTAAIKTRSDQPRSPSMRLAPGIKEKGKTLAITSAKKRQKRAQEAGRQLLIQQTKKAAQAAAFTSRKIVEASVRATKALISALIAFLGGGVLLAAFCLIFLAAAIVSSPFGILFTDEQKTPDTVSLATAMSTINAEYNAQIQALQAGYDTVNIVGRSASWRDVISVYAAKTAATDNGMDVITLDAERVQLLREVFWDMTYISTSTENIEHEDTNPDDDIDDSYSESVLTITVTATKASDMAVRYSFTRYQKEAMEALMVELEEWGLFIGDLEISDATAIEVWNNLPVGLSNERRTVIQYALSLVGKVQYFWGGKSLVLGWDPLWGKSMQVWAAGSPTTGTYRPYGMDCSGFVDWAFYNQSGGSYVIGRGGGVIAQHNNCRAITWSEAIPGDLVFYPGDSHIGIVCGWDTSGNILIVHCASGSLNGVVITGKSGFTTIGRPYYFNE